MSGMKSLGFLRTGFLAISFYLLQAAVAHPLEPGKLGNVDVFGVDPGSIAELERCFGAAAREYVAAASTPGRGLTPASSKLSWNDRSRRRGASQR